MMTCQLCRHTVHQHNAASGTCDVTGCTACSMFTHGPGASNSLYIGDLGPVEQRILRMSYDRLVAGAKLYGNWELHDGRDMVKNLLEEAHDLTHYATVLEMRLGGGK